MYNKFLHFKINYFSSCRLLIANNNFNFYGSLSNLSRVYDMSACDED